MGGRKSRLISPAAAEGEKKKGCVRREKEKDFEYSRFSLTFLLALPPPKQNERSVARLGARVTLPPPPPFPLAILYVFSVDAEVGLSPPLPFKFVGRDILFPRCAISVKGSVVLMSVRGAFV